MGTVLSFSPRQRKPLCEDINLNNFTYEQLNNAKNIPNIPPKEKNFKRHSMFLSVLSWKKFTVNPKKKDKNLLKLSNSTILHSNKLDNNFNLENVNLNKNIQKSVSCYNLKTGQEEPVHTIVPVKAVIVNPIQLQERVGSLARFQCQVTGRGPFNVVWSRLDHISEYCTATCLNHFIDIWKEGLDLTIIAPKSST